MSPPNCVEKMKICTLGSITLFFRKSCGSCDNMYIHLRAVRATDDNIALAHLIVDTQDYKHTFRICEGFLFLHNKNGYKKGPQMYVIQHTLPVLVNVVC
jgi:hypothetical protein